MYGEALVTAPFAPLRPDFRCRITENVNKLAANFHPVAELRFQFVAASLRYPCPDAKDIREIINNDSVAAHVPWNYRPPQ